MSICSDISGIFTTGVFEFVFFKTGVCCMRDGVFVFVLLYFSRHVFEFVFFKTGVFCMRNGVFVFVLLYFSRQVYLSLYFSRQVYFVCETEYMYSYCCICQDRCI